MDAGKAELKMIMLVCLERCCKLDGKIRVQGCSCWWRYWIRKEMELALQEVCVAASSCCCSNGRIGEVMCFNTSIELKSVSCEQLRRINNAAGGTELYSCRGCIAKNGEGTGSDAEKYNETGGVEFVVTDLGGEVCNWCD
ncbi:hypothetical protein C5167_026078 [Papaver somniferum]|nr:hypothetical protein C5167_026078 [Papaver somniferum]